MLRNAPHLTRMVEFVVPCFSAFEKAYYGLGISVRLVAAKRACFPVICYQPRSESFRKTRLPCRNAILRGL